ncbi:response regulator transcription factor [Apibacter adventoris]|uniref:response regulator transcription factor n=1 Tax=Apibacter adventoris TaxID=1679466 RepID=UPI000CF66753|nr:response regulator transcription factor [Apibacter adventoris]PQL95103.1 DNA-binding response regulator [Apibacter adventoris]
MKKILIIEDEKKLSDVIHDELHKNGYFPFQAFDGELGLISFRNQKPDLVLLDVNLPKINGFDLIKSFRVINPNVPIIMLTAFGDIDSKMLAFDNGADDYLIKPIDFKELIAKIKIFLRRSSQFPVEDTKIHFKDVVIDLGTKSVIRNNIHINLTPKEFELFYYLVKKQGRVASKEELADNVWAERYGVTPNTIEVYINFLRNKIDKEFKDKIIQTKAGFGYYIAS